MMITNMINELEELVKEYKNRLLYIVENIKKFDKFKDEGVLNSYGVRQRRNLKAMQRIVTKKLEGAVNDLECELEADATQKNAITNLKEIYTSFGMEFKA